MRLMKNEIRWFGNKASETIFIQLVDEHDMELMDQEAEQVRKLTNSIDYCVRAIPVSDWNNDLSPWAADPVFGKEKFGGFANDTLNELMEDLKEEKGRHFLCGYSLAGLFALWAATRTDFFEGIAAVSPSVWYPQWIAYAKTHPVRTSSVYLSLGDQEEKAKNQTLAAVGNAIRTQHEILLRDGIESVLKWNPGNHFMDSDLRTAKGIAWLLKRLENV